MKNTSTSPCSLGMQTSANSSELAKTSETQVYFVWCLSIQMTSPWKPIKDVFHMT